METRVGDPTRYLQEQFGDAYNETEAARKAVAREAARRRSLAYLLKAVAALGGLVLAAGLVPPLSQGLGLAITAAVTIDGLFSNHIRLITSVKASQAYKRLLRRVVRSHQRDLAPVLQLNDSERSGAQRRLNELNARLLSELHSGAELIETALDEADLKALLRLSLEQEDVQSRGTPPTAT
jgi:hypothetical protein